eukprot:5578213-Prorocentrum_lima.AAC.1
MPSSTARSGGWGWTTWPGTNCVPWLRTNFVTSRLKKGGHIVAPAKGVVDAQSLVGVAFARLWSSSGSSGGGSSRQAKWT